MTEIPEIHIDLAVPEIPNPHNLADLFQHLRLRRQINTTDMTRIVNYSKNSVEANETTMRNPTLKTLMRYIQGLRLELRINDQGITVRDPATDTMIVVDWNASFD